MFVELENDAYFIRYKFEVFQAVFAVIFFSFLHYEVFFALIAMSIETAYDRFIIKTINRITNRYLLFNSIAILSMLDQQ